jgi:hypothetical protein
VTSPKEISASPKIGAIGFSARLEARPKWRAMVAASLALVDRVRQMTYRLERLRLGLGRGWLG